MSNAEEMIEHIIKYAEQHPKFDVDYVESMQDAIEEYGELTDTQYDGLSNIYEKFKINKWISKT